MRRAGQLDSYPDVRTPEELERAVRACWASYWSERVLERQHAARPCGDVLAAYFDRFVGAPADGHGIELDRGGFLAHGTRENVTLVNGMTAANQDIVLAPIREGSIAGSVSAPPGYTIQSKGIELELSPWRHDHERGRGKPSGPPVVGETERYARQPMAANGRIPTIALAGCGPSRGSLPERSAAARAVDTPVSPLEAIRTNRCHPIRS